MKSMMIDKEWMNVPITFPPILARNLSEEALMVEAEMEGYLSKTDQYADNGVWILGRTSQGSMKDRTKCVFQRGRPVLKGNNEIYHLPIPLTLQYYSRLSWPETTSSHPIYHPRVGKKQAVEPPKEAELQGRVSLTEEVLVNPVHPDQLVIIVKKVRGSSRMGIDFNKYNLRLSNKIIIPLPELPLKLESVMGFPLKFVLEVQRLSQEVQMTEEDEEKTSFYTDQGIFSYTKMSLDLKNVGATYQRLVDAAFQSQIGQNLKAYVDDMVVKSKTEKEMIADVAETFDNLQRINMKLNPKNAHLE
ncbi:reverse transcriptase domain-containing protein [Tanacetum coccineum]